MTMSLARPLHVHPWTLTNVILRQCWQGGCLSIEANKQSRSQTCTIARATRTSPFARPKRINAQERTGDVVTWFRPVLGSGRTIHALGQPAVQYSYTADVSFFNYRTLTSRNRNF